MAFGTLADLKIYLGINSADTSEDTYLTNIMSYTSTLIEEFCDRTFGLNTYVEIYSGDGSAFLTLRQRPVLVAGLIVYVDDNAFFGSESGAFPSTTLQTHGTDYCLMVDRDLISSQCGILQSINGFWDVPFSYAPTRIYPQIMTPPYGWGNIKVTYQAGYTTIPPSVYLALYGSCAAVRNSQNYGQLLASESLSDGAGNTSYSPKSTPKLGWITPEAGMILTKFRNIAVA